KQKTAYEIGQTGVQTCALPICCGFFTTVAGAADRAARFATAGATAFRAAFGAAAFLPAAFLPTAFLGAAAFFRAGPLAFAAARRGADRRPAALFFEVRLAGRRFPPFALAIAAHPFGTLTVWR